MSAALGRGVNMGANSEGQCGCKVLWVHQSTLRLGLGPHLSPGIAMYLNLKIVAVGGIRLLPSFCQGVTFESIRSKWIFNP